VHAFPLLANVEVSGLSGFSRKSARLPGWASVRSSERAATSWACSLPTNYAEHPDLGAACFAVNIGHYRNRRSTGTCDQRATATRTNSRAASGGICANGCPASWAVMADEYVRFHALRPLRFAADLKACDVG